MLNMEVKKFLVMLVTIVFIVSSINVAAANLQKDDENTIYLTYTFDAPEVKDVVVSGKTYSVLTMDGCSSIGRVGVPDLPMKVAKILLPPKTRVNDIVVEAHGAHQTPIANDIKLGNNIYYTYALDESGTRLVFATDKDGLTRVYSSKDFSPEDVSSPVYYDKNSVYPGKFFNDDALSNEDLIQYKRGYPILLLPLYPVQYNDAGNSITYYDRLDVQVKLEQDSSLQLNEHYRGLPRDAALVAEIVDNPSTLDAYNSFDGFGVCSETKGGDDGSGVSDPNRNNDPPTDATNGKNPYGDLLIITTRDLYNVEGPYNLQALATAHKANGVEVSILTFEDIYENYIEKLKIKLGVPRDQHIPADIPDWKILQNKVREAYLSGTDYLLIVGDDNWPWQMINNPMFQIAMRTYSRGEEFGRGGHGISLSDPCVPTTQALLFYAAKADLLAVQPLEPDAVDNNGQPIEPVAPDNNGQPIEPDIPDNNGQPIEPGVPIDPNDETGETPSNPNDGIEINSEENNEENNNNLFAKTKLYTLLSKGKESSFIDLLIQKIKLFLNRLADVFSGRQTTPSDNEENRDDTNEKHDNNDNNQNIPTLDPSEIYVFSHKEPVQAERIGSGRWERVPVTTSSDVPYACLDYDTSFGEDELGTYIITQDDYFGEVYVGRAPVETAEELRNFVRKTIKYLRNEETNLDCLMVGEYVGFVCRPGESCLPTFSDFWLENLIGHKETKTMDWEYDEETRQIIVNAVYPLITDGIDPSIYTIHRLYDKDIVDEESKGMRTKFWETNDLISRINDGQANILNHVGHANALSCMRCNVRYSIDTVTGKIMGTSTNFDFNNDEYGTWYSVGCFANAYDFPVDCIGEWFSVKKSGGAAAFVGNTYYGFAGGPLDPSARYHREFWDAAFGEGKTTLGWANQDSKEDNVQYIGLYVEDLGTFGEVDPMRFLYYGVNLCGDPILKIKGI